MFGVIHMIKRLGPVLGGVLTMTAKEQTRPGAARRMSAVLWDMFTGSAPYRDCFVRTLDPRFIARLLWESALAVGRRGNGEVVSYGSGHAG
jgi:hypothetical protein